MKKSVLFVLMIVSFVTYSQEIKQDSVYTNVNIMPEYPNGGINGFYRFVAENYFIPKKALKKEINGIIKIEFIVELDGSLNEIKVVNDLGYGTGEEAIRVLKSAGKWKPGYQNERPVRTKFALPIKLVVD